jgi:hypothetical protein
VPLSSAKFVTSAAQGYRRILIAPLDAAQAQRYQ